MAEALKVKRPIAPGAFGDANGESLRPKPSASRLSAPMAKISFAANRWSDQMRLRSSPFSRGTALRFAVRDAAINDAATTAAGVVAARPT
jgi:hypothetical protein